MKLKDLIMNDRFAGVMEVIHEEFECNDDGKLSLQLILDSDVSSLDADILILIKRFENVTDEYQEAEITQQIQSWFFWKGNL
jgi:hypothetical protein